MSGERPIIRSVPAWALELPDMAVNIVLAHRLTPTQFRALQEFLADPAAELVIAHSTARALRERGLGELTGKFQSGTGSMARSHPKSGFKLGEPGQAVVAALREAGVPIPEAKPEAEISYRNAHGARKWDRQPRPARVKSANHHPKEWDE